MKKTSLLKKIARGFVGITCAGVFLGSTLLGCGTYGKLKRDDTLIPHFESGTIVQGEEYRQTPCGSNPSAIIRFPKGSLDSRLWNCPISDGEELKTKTSKIQENASEGNDYVGGAYMLDDKGNTIGQVYGSDSYLKSDPLIRLKNGHRFSIQTPGMKSSGGNNTSTSTSTSSDTSGGSI